ncbi:uncharacterized protein KY384_006247 [Bacidia gigantensis]|uniref:uncharacterized protein n=1 Tax=Bacidia gigantensis TaxID=2732470 RepID=UPI001D059F8C|nr:uncharacterized protein KY384_006247 [Bacidia gigantensis]KAG8529610.1 hypothetical protein KY384_006247 [Bacidia gigantensis]
MSLHYISIPDSNFMSTRNVLRLLVSVYMELQGDIEQRGQDAPFAPKKWAKLTDEEIILSPSDGFENVFTLRGAQLMVTGLQQIIANWGEIRPGSIEFWNNTRSSEAPLGLGLLYMGDGNA